VRSRPGFAATATSTREADDVAAGIDLPPAPRADDQPALGIDEPPARRTITITGRGAERNLWAAGAGRRRSARRPHERAGFKPDRVAMWAVFLGLLLIFVAAASAHA
jgi:hypothetical protein